MIYGWLNEAQNFDNLSYIKSYSRGEKIYIYIYIDARF